jgi:hypothetical protein
MQPACSADYGGMKPASTSQHTSEINYYATCERIDFEDLSAAVRAAADSALGSPVVRAAAAGHLRLHQRLCGSGVAPRPASAHPVLALARETQVLEALAGQIPAVPMIGAGRSSDGGHVLALDWVEGHLPGFPWTRDEIALVRSACEQVWQAPTAALATLEPAHLADELLADVKLRNALTDGLAVPGSLDQLPVWLPTRIDEVLALAGDIDGLRVENHLNQGPATGQPTHRTRNGHCGQCGIPAGLELDHAGTAVLRLGGTDPEHAGAGTRPRRAAGLHAPNPAVRLARS